MSLEIADRTGSGFRTIFYQAQALDVSNRLLRALIALRNGGKP